MLGAEDAESSLMAITLLLEAWKRKNVAPPVASMPSHVVFVGQEWSGKNVMTLAQRLRSATNLYLAILSWCAFSKYRKY